MQGRGFSPRGTECDSVCRRALPLISLVINKRAAAIDASQQRRGSDLWTKGRIAPFCWSQCWNRSRCSEREHGDFVTFSSTTLNWGSTMSPSPRSLGSAAFRNDGREGFPRCIFISRTQQRTVISTPTCLTQHWAMVWRDGNEITLSHTEKIELLFKMSWSETTKRSFLYYHSTTPPRFLNQI